MAEPHRPHCDVWDRKWELVRTRYIHLGRAEKHGAWWRLEPFGYRDLESTGKYRARVRLGPVDTLPGRPLGPHQDELDLSNGDVWRLVTQRYQLGELLPNHEDELLSLGVFPESQLGPLRALLREQLACPVESRRHPEGVEMILRYVLPPEQQRRLQALVLGFREGLRAAAE